MNFLLAFVILFSLGFIQGAPVDEPRLGKLTSDGAANESGLQEEMKFILLKVNLLLLGVK